MLSDAGVNLVLDIVFVTFGVHFWDWGQFE
jgi:hypothetical protein